MLKIGFDTSPLKNENAHRGIGVYTRLLLEELKKMNEIEVKEIKTKKGDAQVSLTHYPFFDLFFPTLPFEVNKKIVVTIHDVIPLVFPKEYGPGQKGRLRFFRQLLALHFVSAVITDSNASKNDIIKYLKVPADKVHVVYLAPNPTLKPTSSDASRETKEKYKIVGKYVLYVGDINYNKNIPQLIKAVKYFPDDLTLVCIGKNFYPHQIPEWEKIEVQVALSDVTERVVFVPNLQGDAEKDLAALYSGAVCYIQPSLYEGFGLPVVEAMQCKTPVVSTKNSSLLEVGGEVVTYVEPTAESIAEGVKAIYSAPPFERNAIIKKAKKWVEQFSWARAAHETVIVYKQVAGGD